MIVAFPRAPGARISRSSPGSHLHAAVAGLIVTVPSSAHSGHIMVLLSHGRHTSSYGPIYVFRHALHPPAPKHPSLVTPVSAGAASGTAFDGQGMWIWYVSQLQRRQRRLDRRPGRTPPGSATVFVKSSDGSSNYWSQFSAAARGRNCTPTA